jgi:hypothetical protein
MKFRIVEIRRGIFVIQVQTTFLGIPLWWKSAITGGHSDLPVEYTYHAAVEEFDRIVENSAVGFTPKVIRTS